MNTKKRFYLFVILAMVAMLAACSGLQLPWNKTTTNQQDPGANMANQLVQDKLALGILKLEGTPKAVTAAQAKTLLPLWKTIKSLSSSETVTQEEINAVYQQIQDTMTADQIQSVKDLSLAPADFQTLMAQYGIERPQGAAPNSSSTQAAGSQSQANAGGPGGGPGGFPGGGPGGPPPDAGGMPGGGTAGGTSSTQSTPNAPQPGRGLRNGMNFMFIDPLIKLLQQRAGA